MSRKVPVGPYDYLFAPGWPADLVGFLNAQLDPKDRGVRPPKGYDARKHFVYPLPDVRTVRRFHRVQQRLRRLVDFLLREKDPRKRAEKLSRALTRVRATPTVFLRSALGLPPGPGGTPFILRWGRGWDASLYFGWLFVDLARLYDSGYWDSLRKCPVCRRYFLAGGYRRKIYCSKLCMWYALKRRHRARLTEAQRLEQRELARRRYHERRGRVAPEKQRTSNLPGELVVLAEGGKP